MLIVVIAAFLLSSTKIESVRIPFINNTMLKPVNSSDTGITVQLSCDRCLCFSNLTYAALNCFSNNTCQMFAVYPNVYQAVQTPGARLYFPRQILPAVSQRCPPTINDLLSSLRQATRRWANISDPAELLSDDHGYIASIDQSLNTLSRFDATDLGKIDYVPVQTSSSMAITYNRGAYYIKAYTGPVVVINSSNLVVMDNFTLASMDRARSIIFLNDGQTMVVTSYGTDSLVFYNRSSISPINYTLMWSQPVAYSGPCGMWRVNDSFFYVTSYDDYALYSYSRHVNGSWEETFVFDVAPLSGSSGPMHLTVDNDSRIWISLKVDTTLIYDQQGNILGNFTIAQSKIVDVKILDNYIIYISDVGSDRIIRIDPNISC